MAYDMQRKGTINFACRLAETFINMQLKANLTTRVLESWLSAHSSVYQCYAGQAQDLENILPETFQLLR